MSDVARILTAAQPDDPAAADQWQPLISGVFASTCRTPSRVSVPSVFLLNTLNVGRRYLATPKKQTHCYLMHRSLAKLVCPFGFCFSHWMLDNRICDERADPSRSRYP